MRLKPASFYLALLAVTIQAQAASFSCLTAESLVENVICSSPELSDMDDLMLTAYKNALASSSDAGAVQGAQRRWLSERNKCSDMGCLVKAYQTRLWQLLPPNERGDPWVSGVYEAGGNRLDIVQTKPHEFRFRLFAISPTGNTGEIEGGGQIYDGIGKFADRKNECNLTLNIKNKRITLSQVGYCGFGLNVAADGEYRQLEGKSPVVRNIGVK